MKYFKEDEFMMGNVKVFSFMDKNLLPVLDKLRDLVGEPLVITSSFRDVDYNKSVGGAKSSFHLTGKAVDLACNNGTLRAKIVSNALKLGLSVGVAKGFVHLDNRGKQIVFSYG